jgi:DNA-binding transcriptional MocR family regulator
VSQENTQPGHKVWLYEKLAAEIARLIEAGTYPPGSRIPSVRQLSRQRKVSISTVLQAYYLLEDQGLVQARRQSGYYVQTRLPTAFPEPEISSPGPDPTKVSVQELVMMVMRDAQNPDLVQLGPSIPHPELLAAKELNKVMASIIRQGGNETGLYQLPPGYEALRVQIARRGVLNNCSLTPDDVFITSGCVEAIDLCLRATCRPGDTVAIESPLYFGILQNLQVLGLQALEIPTHPRDGISLDTLRFAIEQRGVRACLVISNFNNPLGSCIPEANKQKLVQMLARHEIPLIENDISGELYFSGERPIVAKAFDRRGLVMLCSSFSKDLCPGYRIGWVVPGRFRSAIERLKIASSLATATLPQMAIARFLASGAYDRHLRRVRRIYFQNVSSMSRAIMRYFPEGTRVTRPQGGYVLWVELPAYADSLELYKHAVKAGISITPGPIFSARRQYGNFIRLNSAYWSDRIEQAIKRLGGIIAGMN